MSNLTAKQITFCEQYIITRDIKQSSLSAGYSQSYSKSKAYELLQDEKIQDKIQELETKHNQEHFKRLSIIANKELETILLSCNNDNTRLRAIELIYKLSGVIQDDKITLNQNNSVTTFKPMNLQEFYNIDETPYKELSDEDLRKELEKRGLKNIVADTLQKFDKNY